MTGARLPSGVVSEERAAARTDGQVAVAPDYHGSSSGGLPPALAQDIVRDAAGYPDRDLAYVAQAGPRAGFPPGTVQAAEMPAAAAGNDEGIARRPGNTGQHVGRLGR